MDHDRQPPPPASKAPPLFQPCPIQIRHKVNQPKKWRLARYRLPATYPDWLHYPTLDSAGFEIREFMQENFPPQILADLAALATPGDSDYRYAAFDSDGREIHYSPAAKAFYFSAESEPADAPEWHWHAIALQAHYDTPPEALPIRELAAKLAYAIDAARKNVGSSTRGAAGGPPPAQNTPAERALEIVLRDLAHAAHAIEERAIHLDLPTA